MARYFYARVVELQIRDAALSVCTARGIPVTEPTDQECPGKAATKASPASREKAIHRDLRRRSHIFGLPSYGDYPPVRSGSRTGVSRAPNRAFPASLQ
jgi:hypothetical protein